MKFGMYPQTQVTDPTLIATLNEAAGGMPFTNQDWISYEYYRVTGSPNAYGAYNSFTNEYDYMWFQDIEEAGEKYRSTSLHGDPSYTNQDDNGYYTSITYWFKYEDIVWDVGLNDNNNITLISSTVLNNIEYYAGSSNINSYPADYKDSTLRIWLNNNFYQTAFLSFDEKLMIAPTMLLDVGDAIVDNTFLLSSDDILSNIYNLSLNDLGNGTDYAKALGYGDSYYWLRTEGGGGSDFPGAAEGTNVPMDYYEYYYILGVLPVITSNLN